MKIRTSAILLLISPTIVAAADKVPFRTPTLAVRSESDLGEQRSILKEHHVAALQDLDDKAPQPQAAERAESDDPEVKRQVDAIQTRIDIEEQKLKSEMTKYSRQRQRALTKNDSAQLKRIEKLEQRAIAEYEDRLNQIIKAADVEAKKESVRIEETTRSERKDRRAEEKRAKATAKRDAEKARRKRAAVDAKKNEASKPKPQRRRFRLFNFGR